MNSRHVITYRRLTKQIVKIKQHKLCEQWAQKWTLFEKTLDTYKSATHNLIRYNTAGAEFYRFPALHLGSNVDISMKHYAAGKNTFLLLKQYITVVKTWKQHTACVCKCVFVCLSVCVCAGGPCSLCQQQQALITHRGKWSILTLSIQFHNITTITGHKRTHTNRALCKTHRYECKTKGLWRTHVARGPAKAGELALVWMWAMH